MADHLPPLVTLQEVVTALRVSTHTVRKLMREGRLHPVRLGGRLLFHLDEVKRLIDAATLPTQGEISTE